MLKLDRNSWLLSWLYDSLRVFVVAFLLAVAIFTAWLFTAASWRTPLPTPKQYSPEIARGERVFKENGCFYSCHALGTLSKGRKPAPWNQQGTIPPDLTTSAKRTSDWLLAYLIYPQALLPSSPMRSYDYLGNENIEALIAYLQSIKAPVLSAAGKPSELTEIPQAPLSFESYQKGRSIYRTYCESCHGDEGKGNGIAGRLLLPEPRDFTDAVWMSKQTDLYLFSVVARGKADTAMPAFGDVLLPAEMAEAVNYVKLFSDPITRQQLELPARNDK